jgi:competence ComEA-like helix-hairpin-helix protein
MLPLFFPAKKLSITIDEKLQQQLDSLQQKRSISTISYIDTIPSSDSGNLKTPPVTLFQFDPNTLNEQGFKQLGLNDKVIHTIINYRNKGGSFKTPQDIKKIYGLSNADAEKLIPYIKITPAKNNNYKNDVAQTTEKNASFNKSYHTININSATAEEFKTLPGIGDILANRIVKFRNSMGGFKSVDDVKRTYGLNDSTFNLIRPYLVLK